MPIPPGGLINNFDPINPSSYPGSGTVWTDPVTSLVMDLYGSPSFNSAQGTFFFNGGSQKAYSAAGSYANLTNTFTVNIWVKITDTSLTQPVWINGWRGGGGFTYNGWVLFYDAGAGKFDFGANGVHGSNTWSPTVVVDQWYFLSFTWNSGTLKAYVNGVLANTYTGLANANAYTSDSRFGIGHPDNAPNNVDCTVGPIITYNVELNSTQVASIYNTYQARFTSPIISFDFSDPACYTSGTTINDLSPSNNDFTIGGTGYTLDPNFGGGSLFLSYNSAASRTGLNSFSYGQSAFTLNMWIYQTNVGTSNYNMFFMLSETGGAGPAGNTFYLINQTGSQNISGQFSGPVKNTSYDLTLNNWRMLTVTKPAGDNGTNTKIYVDGVDVTTTTTSPSLIDIDPNFTTFINGAGNAFGFWKNEFYLGELQFHDVALTASQVLDKYNATQARYNVPVHEYDAADPASYPGSGTTLFDIGSGTAANLTLNNATFDSNNDSFALTGSAGSYIRSATGIDTGIGANNFSVQYWFKYNGVTGQPPYNVFLQVGTRASGNFSGFNHNTFNGQFNFEAPGVASYPTGWYPTVGKWYQVTMTVNGSNTATLYVDGVNTYSTTVAFTDPESNANRSISIGLPIVNQSDVVANVDIGPLQIYNRVLSGGEITQYYNDTQIRFTDPIAEYDFSNTSSYPGSGTSLSDLSGSGFTLINSTLSGTFAGSGQSKYYTFAGGSDQFYRDNTTSAFGGTTRLYEASMFLWVRSTDWTQGAGTYRCMAGWGEDIGTGGGQLAMWKHMSPSFFPPGQHGAMGSGWATTSYPTLTDNTWLHLGYVIDGTVARVYLNGSLVNSIPQDFVVGAGPTGTYGWISSATAPYLGPLTLGGLYTNYYPASTFDIAIAQFYNVSLSGTAVSTLYNSQLARFNPTPPPPPPAGLVGGRTFGQGFAG